MQACVDLQQAPGRKEVEKVLLQADVLGLTHTTRVMLQEGCNRVRAGKYIPIKAVAVQLFLGARLAGAGLQVSSAVSPSLEIVLGEATATSLTG